MGIRVNVRRIVNELAYITGWFLSVLFQFALFRSDTNYQNKVTEETRYFISSLDANYPNKLEHDVRAYWPIENNLHWVLDMTINENSNRTCKGYSAANIRRQLSWATKIRMHPKCLCIPCQTTKL